MLERGSNVRQLDWEDIDPNAMIGAGEVLRNAPFWRRPLFIVACYLIAATLFGFGIFANQRAAEAREAARLLAEFSSSVAEIETLPEATQLEWILKGKAGFQLSETTVRQADARVARHVGEIWTSVRRDALLPKVDPELLRKAKRESDQAARQVFTQSGLWASRETMAQSGTMASLVVCLLVTLIAISKRSTTLVVQSLMNGPLTNTRQQVEPARNQQVSYELIPLIPAAICHFQADGTLIAWSQDLEQMLGKSREVLQGTKFVEAFGWHEIGEVAKPTMYRLFAGDAIDGVQWKFRHPSGEELILSAKLVPIKTALGGVDSALVMIEDHTMIRRQQVLLAEGDATRLAVLSALPDSLFRVDLRGNLLEVHDNSSLFGDNPQRLLGTVWQQEISADLYTMFQEAAKQCRLQRRPVTFEYEGLVTGRSLSLEIRLTMCGPTDILIIFADLADRRRAIEAETRSEAKFREIINGSADTLLMLTEEGGIRFASASVTEITGIPAASLSGQSFLALVESASAIDVEGELTALAEHARSTAKFRFNLKHESGAVIPVEAHARNLLGIDQVDCMVMSLRDMTDQIRLETELSARLRELEAINEQLRVSVETDSLTGLKNHQSLLEYVRAAADFVAQGGTISAVLFDIDDFQELNHRRGFSFGDDVLRQFGQAIKASSRDYDLAGRYGAEEFVWLLPEAEIAVARRRAEQLCERLRTQTDGEVRVSLAVIPVGSAQSADDLLAQLQRELKLSRDRESRGDLAA